MTRSATIHPTPPRLAEPSRTAPTGQDVDRRRMAAFSVYARWQSARLVKLMPDRQRRRTFALITHELLIACTVSNAVAASIAGLYGWANPFANSTEPQHLVGFTLCMVANCTLFGALAAVPLVSFIVRGQTINAATRGFRREQQLSTWNGIWVTLTLSWGAIVVAMSVAVAFTLLLLRAGVPVVEYNIHSLIATAVVVATAVRTMVLVVRFRRRYTRKPTAQTAAHDTAERSPPEQPPLGGSTPIGRRSRRSSRSRAAAVRQFCSVILPTFLSAFIATQYVTVARRVHFDTPLAFVLFCVGTTLVKALLPAVTKSFITRKKVRNIHNTFFMLFGPIMHIEVQMRMAVMRAKEHAMPVYISSGVVNVLEVLARLSTVMIDHAIVQYVRKQADRKKQAVRARTQVSERRVGDEASVDAHLQAIDAAFEAWKAAHLRVCATEILADMAAEYCSIGLVSIFMVVLHHNCSIDLPTSTETSLLGLMYQQSVSWATQMLYEVVTDAVAVAVELRAGIPLQDTLHQDSGHYMRWVIPVSAIHSCGLCISSLVAFQQGDAATSAP